MWGNPTDVSISEVGRNEALISVKDNNKGKRFLDSGPWNIKGNLLNLQTVTDLKTLINGSKNFTHEPINACAL
ncbi:hypothetical protein AHAS_Ahas20G0258300 [Arachis hypogaea]